MTDTDGPSAAADSDTLSRSEALGAAAEAFKLSLGQAGPAPAAAGEDPADGGGAAEPARPDDQDEIEATAPAEAAGEDAESQEAGADPDPAAEDGPDADPAEAQPPAIPMPRSWPAEHGELWTSLPPEAQGVIAAREGQRDAAVNARLQEAAALRKAQESEFLAELGAAEASRARALEATELALALIRPAAPPVSMLDKASGDYDPDGYHLAKARHDHALALVDSLSAQQQALRAEQQRDEEDRAGRRFAAIDGAAREALLSDVPEIGDPARAPALLGELIDYAVGLGAPLELFEAPTTALEWHMLWKAREFDRLQAAKARLDRVPKPAPRKPQPAVRPGVVSSPSARAAARRQDALARLERSGSIADGAAVFKDFLTSKG